MDNNENIFNNNPTPYSNQPNPNPNQMNPGINPYIMSNTTPEPPKKPSKTILIIAIATIVVMFGVIVALFLIPKPEPTPDYEFDYEEFNKAETDLRDFYNEMQSDPVFSITPYTDPDNRFTINAWFVDENYYISITPSCNDEQSAEYINLAKDYLTTNLGTDLSKYHIQEIACPTS